MNRQNALVWALLLTLAISAFAGLSVSSIAADPPASAVPASLADDIEREIKRAMDERKMPGCVVLIGLRGAVIHRAAYGNRRLEPTKESMTLDTVFDLASLTKPIVTATSVMLLVERGQLRLDDAIAKHIPEFANHGKEAITIEQLLLHTGGLVADNPLSDYNGGYAESLKHIYSLKPVARPGEQFIYSDMGFIVLGLLVEKVSGQSLDEFARANIFEQLDMVETSFKPGEELRKRAAPTEKRDDEWLVGAVHDPRAAKLGGVAGHAGAFSTADDLAKFAETMLHRGRHDNTVLLSEATWKLMTQPRDLPRGGLRALGWDVKTGYSTNRGTRLSKAAFGHGGFTGTSLWIDPQKQLFVIFLSNRLHPDGKGSVNPLAGRIADIVVEATQ